MESEDKMSPPAKFYPPPKRPGDLERHFHALFDKKRNKTHACVRVVFSMKPKMNSEKLPKLVLIVVVPPLNAVNALIFFVFACSRDPIGAVNNIIVLF